MYLYIGRNNDDDDDDDDDVDEELHYRIYPSVICHAVIIIWHPFFHANGKIYTHHKDGLKTLPSISFFLSLSLVYVYLCVCIKGKKGKKNFILL